MKRRSRAGGEPIKGRRREATKPKHPIGPKAAPRANSTATGKETEVTRLTRELNEARDQQTATSEVLQVISSSPGDLEPIFAAMLEKAVRICDANFGNVYRWDNNALYLLAAHRTPQAFAEARRRSPHSHPGPKTITGQMLATKAVVHIVDAATQAGYLDRSEPAAIAAVELGGARTILAVPMRRTS